MGLPKGARLSPRHTRYRLPHAPELGALAIGLAAIGVLTALYFAWLGVTNPTLVALSFLLVVLLVATVSTRRVAIATSLMAFLCFNYFFLPPVGKWTIADPQNWVALFTLLAVSIIASHLSSQVRQRAKEATARRDELARLFDLTRDILLTAETTDAVALVARYIRRRFGLAAATICLPGPRGWQLHHSGERTLDIETGHLDKALAAARARLEFDAHERTYAGHTRIESRDGTAVWLVPLRIGTRPIGVLALEGEDIEPGTRDAIAGVTAIAIERTQLLEERKEAEVVRRSAELKAALLASLGHDLKTPLTAVTVAANNLDASWLTDEQRQEQAEIVRAELARLNRLFQDIVDMARIEINAVAAELEWVQPAEIVEAAARQVEHALRAHKLQIDAGTERALVRLDPRLTSAALAHLLENAGQYSPPGSTITVSVTLASEELKIAVRDKGAGIARQDLDHLFERFYRGVDARQQRFGTGMGLAITRGLLAAEGGRVWAENHPEGGAVFTISVSAESRMAAALEGESL
jgi:two-component system, OmpR family, sensor histidine kinase KdpD